MKYIIILLILSSCSSYGDLRYTYNDYKEHGYFVTDEYDLTYKNRAVFLENSNKTSKYGYTLHRNTIFAQWKFPF